MRFFAAIKLWWRSVRRRLRIRRVVFVASTSLVPRSLGKDLYVVGPRTTPKWAFLQCPCGCGDRIDVNLSRSRQPSWELHVDHDGRITLNPSLWRPVGTCRSHFWIRQNHVVWV